MPIGRVLCSPWNRSHVEDAAAVFRVKICGITTAEDARLVAAAGADAVGLNFYEKSARFVELGRAEEIAAAVEPGVAKVGVFVNAAAAAVCEVADRLQLDWIQLHGDEPPESLSAYGSRLLIKALPWTASGSAPIAAYLAACRQLKRLPDGVLVDGHAPGQYGGTGRTAAWQRLRPPRSWLAGRPLILAGGLTPENVGAAIRVVRPVAVDTASGAESAPGKKDAERVTRFVAQALGALDHSA